jgi:hypothetical protein
MVGLVPTDGATMLIKRFSVATGTTITGVRLENNDAATTFPEVALVRGPLASVAGGAVVASASNVQPMSGLATVIWPSPVSVVQAGTYYVAVRFPSASGRHSAGRGPALGANTVSSPNGSYLAGNSSTELIPLRADLAISLVTDSSSGGPTKVGTPVPDEPPVAQERFFTARSTDGRFPAIVSFSLERPAQVVLNVYDVSGRLVRTLLDEALASGSYERHWNGADDGGSTVAAGIYFVRLQRDRDVLTDRLVVTK